MSQSQTWSCLINSIPSRSFMVQQLEYLANTYLLCFKQSRSTKIEYAHLLIVLEYIDKIKIGFLILRLLSYSMPERSKRQQLQMKRPIADDRRKATRLSVVTTPRSSFSSIASSQMPVISTEDMLRSLQQEED